MVYLFHNVKISVSLIYLPTGVKKEINNRTGDRDI